MKRAGNFIIFVIAALYFALDAIFATVAIPLGRWIAAHLMFERLHRWILSLGPYPTLVLFILPLIVLEPVKPVAAYLAGTGHVIFGLVLVAVGEILKLVLVERLFSVSRDKLLSIPAFAWSRASQHLPRRSKSVIARQSAAERGEGPSARWRAGWWSRQRRPSGGR